MGNCQAIDAAALVIQHPCGKIERFYWAVTASEVMRMNPGHYVSLIIPLPPVYSEEENLDRKTVRFTRVKLLRSNDTLVLGHAYRLITSQEVMKVLKAKKFAKLKKQNELESAPEKDHQGMKQERHRPRVVSTNSVLTRSKSWQPSLQSISEAAS